MPTTKDPASPRSTRQKASPDGHHGNTDAGHAYVVPMVHLSLPESAVNIGFWSVLAGSVAFGAVDLPLGALIGAGVLIARHHHRD